MTAPPGIGATTPVPRVIPAPGSRLEQLLALRQAARDDVKAKKNILKAAEDHLNFINDGIEAEAYRAVADRITGLVPSETRIEIAGSQSWPALRMLWIRPWRINSKRMQAEDPVTYVRFAERGKGYWDLRSDGENDGDGS